MADKSHSWGKAGVAVAAGLAAAGTPAEFSVSYTTPPVVTPGQPDVSASTPVTVTEGLLNAKIDAVEAKVETRFERLLGEIKVLGERLGGIDRKVDQIVGEQSSLKASVEKHDKLIARAGFTIAGAVVVVSALWFLYEHFLAGHITYR